jgi:hypothetical protein
MTVSANSDFELSRDQLIRRAFQLSQVIEAGEAPRADDISMASDILGMELDALQADGTVLRTIERTNLTLASGTASYALSGDCIDVHVNPDNKAGMVWETAGSETAVISISRQDYESLGNKTATGTPSLCYIEKGPVISLLFWPVPDSAMTFRYSKVRLIKDMDTGAVTLDLARRWQKAIVYSMAWQIAMAKGIGMEKVGFLKKCADEFRFKALSDDQQRGDAQLSIQRYGFGYSHAGSTNRY